MNWRNLIFRSVLVTALAAAIIWLGLQRELLQTATIERELQRFGGWAPILFLLLYAVATVLFVPGSVLTVAGGALFGPIWGTLWNLTGATLGATLAFVIARYVASDWVAARSGQRLGRLMRGVEEEGWRFVAFVRLVPLFPFNLMNYAFGLTRIAPASTSSPPLCAWGPAHWPIPIWATRGARRPSDRRGQSATRCLHWRCLRPSHSCRAWFAG